MRFLQPGTTATVDSVLEGFRLALVAQGIAPHEVIDTDIMERFDRAWFSLRDELVEVMPRMTDTWKGIHR